ncbi:MAG TPA: acetyl-CoA carboxylase biotin carboxyl carrier protein, partial [Pseudonocardiaceae bacterium]|nr:acetyl-CoA carboxylase biotin carboxyl carrier protein [Pseudonocardiaceae bacterium]
HGGSDVSIAPQRSADHPDRADPDGDVVDRLSDAVSRLADTVSGPLRRVSLQADGAAVELEWHHTDPPPAAPAPAAAPAGPPPETAEALEPDEPDVVRSPMVGTFYHAPAPGEPPFVSVGGVVEPDTVIGLVEAMKLMNQITAERAGVVRTVLVPDGRPVEFEQPLLVLDPLPERDGTGR